MGGCCSAHEKDGITLVGYVATVEKRNKRLDEANRQILRWVAVVTVVVAILFYQPLMRRFVT